MAELIGSSTYFSTWAACRTAIGNGAPNITGSGFHNYKYVNGFMSAEGNGLLRFDPFARLALGNSYFIYDDFTFTFLLEYATIYSVIDQKDADELIGETVTLTGPATFAISADYITSAGQSVVSSGYPPITAIGKLTPF